MDQVKELRIDLLLYFVLIFGSNFKPITIVFFTVFFALRFWYPEMLVQMEIDLAEEIACEQTKID